jgi:hypothetical protein
MDLDPDHPFASDLGLLFRIVDRFLAVDQEFDPRADAADHVIVPIVGLDEGFEPPGVGFGEEFVAT